MEAYTAADERPLDLCLRDVAQSDIYVGLWAWRYGYVPPADESRAKSGTVHVGGPQEGQQEQGEGRGA
jgi:hypothetical protein